MTRGEPNNDAARLCHAVVYRVHSGADPDRLARNFSRAVRLDRGGRLWIETVAGRADDPVAARWREREITRAVDPATGPPLRGVLLRYTDGLADLIVVAHRTHADRTRLELLMSAILVGLDTDIAAAAAAPEAPGLDLRRIDQGPAPEWGLGSSRSGMGQRRFSVAVPQGEPLTVFAAALGIVLRRYTPERHVVVGRCDAPGSLSLAPADGLDVSAYLGSVELEARPVDAADAHPVVGVAMSLPSERLMAEGVEARPLEYRPFLAPVYPLSLHVEDVGAGLLRAGLTYRCDRFGASVVARFIQEVSSACLRLATAEPNTPLAELDLLDDAERRRATLGGLGQPLKTSADRIHDRVARRAAETPDAVALCFEDDRLTYRELDLRANRVAHVLRGLGVTAETRVGVCLDRGVDLVVTLLAVLKAGAAYVPMDPTYPTDRLAFTVRDAELPLVVTALEQFPACPGTQAKTPKELMAAGMDAPATPPDDASRPDSAAYVIYTSGSTGTPKGVAIPHRNVLALLGATQADFALGPRDTWTLFHSSAFDFSVWEIWGCLMTGGRLVIVPYWVSRSPDEFRDLLAAERVTILNQTPSAFTQLLESDRARPLPRVLRLVIFGGEPLDAGALREWFDRHPESECRMVNMFGITETTVHVTAQTVTRRETLTNSRSVGRPLNGWHVYVMDERGRLAPPGVPGEIYVGGAGVAPGYLNRSELTAQRFLPDPYAEGTMYRSGDRGRLLPDGRLEHLGRLDNQVKLRGHRIELDGIRTRLLDHPAVAAAAVVLAQEAPEDPASARLDAYVVLSGRASPSEIRQRAAKFLPDHMLPSTVTALPALPLTSNGKLDTSRLPPPSTAGSRPDLANHPTHADTGVEEMVLTAWEQVFGFRVGPHDDFFALGGNSLLAVRLSAALRERELPPLALRDLYLNPTAGRVAALLGDAGRAGNGLAKEAAA